METEMREQNFFSFCQDVGKLSLVAEYCNIIIFEIDFIAGFSGMIQNLL